MFIMWKCYKLLNLKIGMKNQLGSLRYDDDIMLGSIAIFANGQFLSIVIVYTIISTLATYFFYII